MIISEEKWRPAATQTTVTICQSKAISVFFTKEEGHNMMIESCGKIKTGTCNLKSLSLVMVAKFSN
jgi:hypothetical protein